MNREPYELDPAMFEDELPDFARGRTARVAAGLGSIARIVGEGQEIYAPQADLRRGAAPYRRGSPPLPRRRWRACSPRRKAAFGVAILVDWHSMPSAAAQADGQRGRRPPDFVLGDRFGAACGPQAPALVERELEAMGYATARNVPYAGGYTTEHYGRPAEGVHALQIEINRALYLNERVVRPHGGFDRLARDLERLFERLTTADWSGLSRA